MNKRQSFIDKLATNLPTKDCVVFRIDEIGIAPELIFYVDRSGNKKLDNNPTKGWLYQLYVLAYMLFHDSLYLAY